MAGNSIPDIIILSLIPQFYPRVSSPETLICELLPFELNLPEETDYYTINEHELNT